LQKLLRIYGLKINHAVQKRLETYLVVPGEGHKADDVQQTISEMQHEVEFQVVLKLKTSATCKVMVELYADLRSSIKPILNYLDFLEYFHLHSCELFNKYLKHQVDKLCFSDMIDHSGIEIVEDDQTTRRKPDENFVKVCTTL